MKRGTLTFIFLNQGWHERKDWPTECGECDILGLLGSGPEKSLWSCCLRSPGLLCRQSSQPGAFLKSTSWAHASSIHFKSPDLGIRPSWAVQTDAYISGIPLRVVCPCLLKQKSHPAKLCPAIWHKIIYQYEFTMCFIFKKLCTTVHWKGLEIIINPVALSTHSAVLWSLNTISHLKSPGAHLNGWSQVWAGNTHGRCKIYHPENKEATKNFQGPVKRNQK